MEEGGKYGRILGASKTEVERLAGQHLHYTAQGSLQNHNIVIRYRLFLRSPSTDFRSHAPPGTRPPPDPIGNGSRKGWDEAGSVGPTSICE